MIIRIYPPAKGPVWVGRIPIEEGRHVALPACNDDHTVLPCGSSSIAYRLNDRTPTESVVEDFTDTVAPADRVNELTLHNGIQTGELIRPSPLKRVLRVHDD